MKQFLPFLMIITLWLTSCGPDSQTVIVTVIDNDSQRPLDSTEIQLLASPEAGGPEEVVSTFFTNEDGRVSFSYSMEEGMRYQVLARKGFYQSVVNEGGDGYLNQAGLNTGDSAIVDLALALIEAPDPGFLSKIREEVSVEEVLGTLKGNAWSYAILPQLSWQDVPALLAMGGDTTLITRYPLHPTSSYKPASARVGLVALWLVEAIRKMEMKGSDDIRSIVPPSRAPILGTRMGNPSGHNTAEQIERAQAAYQAWYEAVEAAPRSRRINELRNIPLRNEGMSWM